MLPGRIAFALKVLGRVDPALGAHRVRPLYRHDGKQIHVAAHFSDLDGRRQAREPATHHDDSRSSCHRIYRPPVANRYWLDLDLHEAAPVLVSVAADAI